MSKNQARQEKGQRIGGEFKAEQYRESDVDLGVEHGFELGTPPPWEEDGPVVPEGWAPRFLVNGEPLPLPDPTGEPNDPVEANDERINHGAVFEAVKGTGQWEGTVFRRRTADTFPDQPYAIRIQADRDISDEELEDIAGRTAYAFAMAGPSEGVGLPVRDSKRSFVISADTTKGRVYRNLDRFEDALPLLLSEGSEVRKTNRSGPGTAGTRRIEGLGNPIRPEVYYDHVNDW